ncbi:epithelial membrane protein 3 [Alligator mississippiensis]|uniref:epithelial membrane protein 3 n=1 Tax=Alligator mississippiensis TaxID=8496 RepID=UPI0003D0FA22|nr:epithelial membrane protein 3 [Alligator mississippiensis]XP_019344365.1 epithelial membrane protein 3 [Alligator mississippiensis]
MSFLLFGVTALHILILVLLFVATLDKSWWVLPDEESVNLWYDCLYYNTTQTWVCSSVSNSEWLVAVQALMVLALLFSSFSFILFMCQLYTMERGGLFYATGIFQIFACLSVFTAAMIYTVHVSEFHQKRAPGGRFGYCFVLAWLTFPLSLISSIMYIHLRKRE